jgi:hypothetical protein
MSNPLNLHAIEWFNFYGDFKDIFTGVRNCNMITVNEAALINPLEPSPNDLNTVTFKNGKYMVQVCKPNDYDFPNNAIISRFSLLCAVKFKRDIGAAISYIQYELMGQEIPYIRVGTDYYKVISKQDRYGANQTHLKPWKKDEIKQDHSKNLLSSIPKFDDFIIDPDNTRYSPIIKNCYNLYSQFSHTPYPTDVNFSHFPVTYNFLQHIFNNGTPDKPQLDAGLIYFKVLYEYPKHILPILCLISKPRETGKTTFINWLQMIFGANYVSISSDALTKQFNSNYANKNIITFEETFIEKQQGIEKLKHLSTAKSIDVSQKFISEYSIPFYGKFILCSNKVLDFMRIDKEENRFWIRPIPVITNKRNTKIEQQLFDEIPYFLKYLTQLPPIDFDNGSRMVLNVNQTQTDALSAVKEDSKSWLHKEIEILIEDFFNENPNLDSFQATSSDIKHEWFKTNNQVSVAYIRKVIVDEIGLQCKKGPSNEVLKYYRFGRNNYDPVVKNMDYKTGWPFEFHRNNEILKPVEEPNYPF